MNFDLTEHNQVIDKAIADVNAATLDAAEEALSRSDRELLIKAADVLTLIMRSQRLADQPWSDGLSRIDMTGAAIDEKLDRISSTLADDDFGEKA